MNFSKYFAFLALLVLCLLGQHAADAHFLGKFGKDVKRDGKDALKVVKVAGDIGAAAKIIKIGEILV